MQIAIIRQMRMEPNPFTIKSICDKIYLFLMIQKPLQCLEVPKITGATERSQTAGYDVAVDQRPGNQVLPFRYTSFHLSTST